MAGQWKLKGTYFEICNCASCRDYTFNWEISGKNGFYSPFEYQA
jgi:hypothetical protein